MATHLLQTNTKLDPLQLGMVLTNVMLSSCTTRHHCSNITDPVVDIRHQRPPATHPPLQ